MELIQYINLVRRWLWVLILAGFIGGSVSFITRVSQPQMYRAQTLIAIGGFIQSPNPDQQEIRTGFELTETYAQLVRTQDVLEATLEAVVAPLDTKELDEILDTRILPNTSLLQLSITYTDPILSADLVNELARQLIFASPSNLTPSQRSQVDLLNEQITSLTNEINALRGRVSVLDAQLSGDNLSESERESLQVERTTLINQINQASSNIAQFTNTVASLQERTNSVEIVETARIPDQPLSQSIVTTTILGILVFGAIAFGLVLLYEYLNDTFHNAEEVTQILNLPMLGVISRYGNKNTTYQEKLLTNNLGTRTPDEYRILRTNLLFSGEGNRGIFAVTSALPSEGKSITTTNLAISMALSGQRVLLIDADLRRPRLHEIFDLDNHYGLTSLLSNVPTLSSHRMLSGNNGENLGQTAPIRAQVERIQGTPQSIYSPDTWLQVVQPSNVENLQIITSGRSVDNPTELLGSTLMKRWIQIIQKSQKFDVILIDTPPSLGFPDSAVISASLNAKVIFLIQAGRTRREAAVRMLQRFQQINAEVIGTILNQVNPREESYYGYDYYYSYYTSNTPSQQNGNPETQ